MTLTDQAPPGEQDEGVSYIDGQKKKGEMSPFPVLALTPTVALSIWPHKSNFGQLCTLSSVLHKCQVYLRVCMSCLTSEPVKASVLSDNICGR